MYTPIVDEEAAAHGHPRPFAVARDSDGTIMVWCKTWEEACKAARRLVNEAERTQEDM